jgi:hypothetical protein
MLRHSYPRRRRRLLYQGAHTCPSRSSLRVWETVKRPRGWISYRTCFSAAVSGTVAGKLRHSYPRRRRRLLYQGVHSCISRSSLRVWETVKRPRGWISYRTCFSAAVSGTVAGKLRHSYPRRRRRLLYQGAHTCPSRSSLCNSGSSGSGDVVLWLREGRPFRALSFRRHTLAFCT